VEDRRKEEEMTTPITLPPMDELTLTELRRRYEETTNAETRTRYQMLLLADVEQHFQALVKAPAEVLRHIGSPFAPDKEQDVPLSLAQAA
jgi:hypothetical protein